MVDEPQRTCAECQGSMFPITLMDKYPGLARRQVSGPLEYRLPDDHVSFWSGKYPTAGVVRAYLCAACGRIALYGDKPDAEPGAAPYPAGR